MAVCVFQKSISLWQSAASSRSDGDKDAERGGPASRMKMRGRRGEREGWRESTKMGGRHVGAGWKPCENRDEGKGRQRRAEHKEGERS